MFVNRWTRYLLAASSFALGALLALGPLVRTPQPGETAAERSGVILFGLLLVAAAARFAIVGTVVKGARVVVRFPWRTTTFGAAEVMDARTVFQGRRRFPAAVLYSGRTVPLPMLERGLLFEGRGDEQWDSTLRAFLQECREASAEQASGRSLDRRGST